MLDVIVVVSGFGVLALIALKNYAEWQAAREFVRTSKHQRERQNG